MGALDGVSYLDRHITRDVSIIYYGIVGTEVELEPLDFTSKLYAITSPIRPKTADKILRDCAKMMIPAAMSLLLVAEISPCDFDTFLPSL